MSVEQTSYELLENYLNKHYVSDKTSSISHTLLNPGQGRGRYYIKNEELDEFFDLYSNAIQDGFPVRLVERPRGLSCIKVDIDMRFDRNLELKTHTYTLNDIKELVKAYIFQIERYFSLNNEQIKAFVYEIEKPIKEEKENGKIDHKDGIHIMFPYIVSKPEVQHIIRNNIIECFSNIFDKDDILYINDIKDVIDKRIIDNTGWLMYGSSKVNREPYKLTHVFKKSEFNIIDDEIELIEEDVNDYKLLDIIKLSSIRNKNNESEFNKDKIEEIEKYNQKKNEKDLNREKKNYDEINSNPEIIKEYLDMYLPFRYINYNSWIDVGMALHNIGNGDDEYLELWNEFSKKSDKYQKNICKKKWNSFDKKDEQLGIGSIRYWASLDNRPAYINFTYKLGNFKQKIGKSLEDPYDYDISQVVIELYRDQFVYHSKDMEWYQFKDNRWRCVKKEPLDLLGYLSTDVVTMFSKYYKEINLKKWQELKTDEERSNAAKDAQKIYKAIEGKLKNNRPKNGIINETKRGFINEDFFKLLDQNINLIGFNNGVYDLNTKTFRNGCPNDYVSMSTGYDYIEYDNDDPVFKEIKDFFKSIQPNVSEKDIQRRKYLKQFLASCIQGINYDETFHILTGMGRNGKSKLIELMEKALGDYAGKLSISFLTKQRGKSSDASPDIVKVKTQRFVTLQESDPNDKINNGILKEATGGDKQTGRELYKEPVTFKPLYKLVLICNDIPKMQNPTDHAVHERLRIIDFPSRYVKGKLNKSNSYEQLADSTLSKKIESWGPHFMTLLIKWFHKYFPTGDVKLYPPEVVSQSNQLYKTESDNWNDYFVEEITLIETNDEKDKVSLNSQILSHFKIWCRENDITPLPNLSMLKDYLRKKYKLANHLIVRGKLIGWKITYNS